MALKYLPIDQGPSSHYQVFSREPVRVTYSRKCEHPREPTPYNYMDRRTARMDRFYGTCCRDCGRILTRTQLK